MRDVKNEIRNVHDSVKREGCGALAMGGASLVEGGASLVEGGTSLVEGGVSPLADGASLLEGGASLVDGASIVVVVVWRLLLAEGALLDVLGPSLVVGGVIGLGLLVLVRLLLRSSMRSSSSC